MRQTEVTAGRSLLSCSKLKAMAKDGKIVGYPKHHTCDIHYPGAPTSSLSHPNLSRCRQLTSGCPKAHLQSPLQLLNHKQPRRRSLASTRDLKRRVPQRSQSLQLQRSHLSKPQPGNGDRSSYRPCPKALKSQNKSTPHAELQGHPQTDHQYNGSPKCSNNSCNTSYHNQR